MTIDISPSTIYLITGANRPRGIGTAHHVITEQLLPNLPLISNHLGFGLVTQALEKHENAFVYAGVRNPEAATALQELKDKFPGRIEIVKCVSGDSVGNAVVAQEIEHRHGRVDTVIANAAMWNSFTPVSEVRVEDLEEHFHVNTTGPIVLFQSMFSLLKKSPDPRFVSISSIGGCIGMGLVPTQVGGICYGATKAALNWATRKIHFENDWLVAFPMSPGGVSTDMVTDACDDDPAFKSLVSGAEPTAAEAAVSILKVIDEATREKNGGEFMHLDGTKIPSCFLISLNIMSPSTIYLITGANRPRGIGFGLVKHALEKHEDSFVYAGARDPLKATALQDLKTKYPGRIAVVKCVSGDEAGNAAVAKEIEERHGRVDTVIANAALWNAFSPVSEVVAKDLEEHFHVNVTGPIVLFQSVLSLLKKSANPRFISVSSVGGCIGTGMGIVSTQAGGICYGSTKAALNWATRKIHFENDWLVAFPLSPGAVDTDMVKDACDDDAVFKKLWEPIEPVSVANAAALILKVVDESTREKNGGEFMHLDGSKIPTW
ncbi:hypothetical protein CVT25_001891 [Psilocybe cyanescens]|uniref:Ketoreductase (KR) domain-containing protein n=1 Tax=Psilocybe cyanescens TaxID=93625 RepID=A0A409WQV6_PSICY|nr:hypothetical protein CVT25_001891 [Psilocybe cyanescens]